MLRSAALLRNAGITSMSQSSTSGTAAPTPAASIRGDAAARTGTTPAASSGTDGLVVPEGKVCVRVCVLRCVRAWSNESTCVLVIRVPPSIFYDCASRLIYLVPNPCFKIDHSPQLQLLKVTCLSPGMYGGGGTVLVLEPGNMATVLWTHLRHNSAFYLWSRVCFAANAAHLPQPLSVGQVLPDLPRTSPALNS